MHPQIAPPVFTKLHPSYHLNSTQPDHAMWQSPPLKISEPEQATCHNPTLTKLTTQILPRHHLLHLTHETLTLVSLPPSTAAAAAISVSHHGSLFSDHHRASTMAATNHLPPWRHLHLRRTSEDVRT